ncbi:alkylated DNA repair protein alkB homolog 8-like isoform X2 [Dendronephthya gigantea]|uniref:alkylated DNA repair protein alkB homolog 8-like isoform X2 n=1 Tax=Dendronephthya gigantea TaxID=151771 RepID=UPI00106B8AF2|nr:alkylated DNA repair protein alkB homolog 8-like isoform X2 [Dendronephthya gigantea]
MASERERKDRALGLSMEIKLTKAQRKMVKKQNKALHTLKNREKEVGEISDVPTAYLLVKNGGLMCGVERQDLVNVFKKYGKLDDIIMLPGKSFSYVLFCNSSSAEEAMASLNGQKLCFNQNIFRNFYLAYLKKRPHMELCLSNKDYPAGMILIEEFINELQELELLQRFFSCEEDTSVVAEQQLKHRYVKHYGYEFLYGSNNVDKDKPLPDGIPSECSLVVKKLVSLDCVKHEPDQLTINEYKPGQGIPPHVDTHSAFEDGITCLSLGAKVAMDFRHPDGRHVSILLPRRSVLIMTGECRYEWTHGITPRKYDIVNEDDLISNKNSRTWDSFSSSQQSTNENSSTGDSLFTTHQSSNEKDSNTGHLLSSTQHPSNAVALLPREVRLSLTFRKVRRTPCDCKYPSSCDSQDFGRQSNKNGRENVLPQSEEDAVNLEKAHVHNVYDNIAEHFSGTRHSPWPKIAEFLNKQPRGSIVADVGCGNGKYLGINDQLLMFGSDRSQNLAAICRERGYHVVVCDILSLPYRSDTFDVCICIAVIHHLSTITRRLAAIKELARIIRPGGRILISVWALEQSLGKRGNRGERPHSGTSTSIDEKAYTPAGDDGQGLEQPRSSEVASEGINPSVQTTGGTYSVIMSDMLDNYQRTVYKDRHRVNFDSEDAFSISKSICTSSHEIDRSCPNDASEIPSPSSVTSIRNSNCPSTAVETSSCGDGETHPQREQECVSNNATSEENLLKLKVNASRNMFEQQDLLIPWHYHGNKNSSKNSKESSCTSDKAADEKDDRKANSAVERKVFQRFYHVFKEHELTDECSKIGNVSIVRSYYDKGNWCVELEKVRDY